MSRVAEYAAYFAALALVLWLPGFAIVRSVRPFRELTELRPLAEWCLGTASWIIAVFALAAAQALRGWSLACLALAVALAAALAKRRCPAPPRPTERGAPPALEVLLLVGIGGAAMAFLFLVGALRPGVAWDADVYHLTLPKLYLAHGGFRRVPFNVYSNWPLAAELLFAMALAAKDFVLASVLHWGFGLLVLLALHLGCRAFGRPGSGWLAMAFFLANEIVGYELGGAHVDLIHAFFFFSGFLFALRARTPDALAPAHLLLAGICCGIAAGTKVTGLAGAAVVAAVYAPELARAARAGELLRAWRGFLLRFALPVSLLWLPWPLKAAWYTGNPFYPLGFEYLGGPEWSTDLTARFVAWQRSIGMGREPGDYLRLPLRILLDAGPGYAHFDGTLGGFWLVLLPLTLALGMRQRAVRCALGAAGLGFAAWALASQQLRLLIPTLTLPAFAAALVVGDRIERIGSRAARRVVGGAVLALALGFVARENAVLLLDGFGHLLLYRAEPQGPASAAAPVHRFIDAELPADARLLFLNDNRGFFCEREYVADSFFEASQIADWLGDARGPEEVAQRLAARGLSHVLVHDHDWGIDYPEALDALLADPRRAERLYRSADGSHTLLRLRDPARATPSGPEAAHEDEGSQRERVPRGEP